MAENEPPRLPIDLAAMAAEALDLWQDHLALTASDPTAKAEMIRLLEPSRRVFADWTTMMQNGAHAPSPSQPQAPATPGTETARPASDDSALRIAQLAHRVAELERRLAKLEQRGSGKAQKASGDPGDAKSGT